MRMKIFSNISGVGVRVGVEGEMANEFNLNGTSTVDRIQTKFLSTSFLFYLLTRIPLENVIE